MHTRKVHKGREKKILYTAHGVIIRADEVANYCDETFYSALEKWALTKMWGMPHGGGWAEEPVDFIDAITTLESEQNAIEAEEIEKKTNKGNVTDVKAEEMVGEVKNGASTKMKTGDKK